MSAKIEVISNESTQDHSKTILDLFPPSEEIWMATAFLKSSGLNILMPAIKNHIKAKKPITIIAGQHFGLTDPEALQKLHDLFKSYPNAKIFLDKALSRTDIFHPKISLFKFGTTGFIVSGSANLTSGGLGGNTEISLKAETSTFSSEWKEAIQFVQNRCSEEHADILSLLILNRYRSYYSEEEKKRKDQNPVPEKNSKEYAFDYPNLLQYLKVFRIANGNEVFDNRLGDYREAKKVLNEIVDSPRLTQDRFEELLDRLVVGERLWYSGSLFRHRKKVYRYRTEFRDLVRFVRDNQNGQISHVFDEAKERVKSIEGAAVNYITEIMMTYRPDRFANLNSNPIKVLNDEAGVYFKSHSSSFNGHDYKNYCLLLQEISEKLKLRNMLEVDSFFNDIYWKIKSKTQALVKPKIALQ